MSDIIIEKETLGHQLLAFDPYTKIHVVACSHGLVLDGFYFPDILIEKLEDKFLERDDIYVHFSDEFDCWSLYIYD